MSIMIDKIGLKDAQQGYVDAFFTVSVVAPGTGDLLPNEPAQDTPVWTSREPQYIHFGHTITFNTPVETLRETHGWAIFFEFKHRKANGNSIASKCYTKDTYVSTKCYSFMELDECQGGPVVLEICKCEKPTDMARSKKPYLLSSKELYFHVNVSLKCESESTI